VTATPPRRLDGWGFAGESYPPSAALLHWLGARLGAGEPFPTLDPATLALPDPAPLPELGCAVATDAATRFGRSRGQGLPDLLRLRSATVRHLPDGVARPADEGELETLLEACDRHRLRTVLRGGGTSVTGGVNVGARSGKTAAGKAGSEPAVVVDLGGLAGLEALDEASGLATFGAGTLGPALETALGEHGFTLGHFPQSFQLSTLGGWIATRSTGQESLGYGRIEQMVAGVEALAPGGTLRLPALPASAAGPDLRQLLLGSEGRLGVVTRATVRVRRRPAATRVEAALLPHWTSGVEASRELVQAGVPLSILRLSDAPETEVAMAVGLGASRWAPLVRAWLRLRGIGDDACLLLLGASSPEDAVSHGGADAALEAARTLLRRHGAAWLGAGPGRKWLADRFRHPYLRDALLDRGYATDTFETAAPWSALGGVYATVRGAFAGAAGEGEREVPLLCHLSHPYRDGASLYFTFFYRCPRDPDDAVARWADLKRRATEAVVVAGGTVSHHHGIGAWHAPWYPGEVGSDGLRLLRTAASELDPRGILEPGVLLDPTDRLEE